MWIVYSIGKLYACWIRCELLTVNLSSSMLIESDMNCLQYYQVVCLLNQLWIVYNIVKFYGCWIKCELFTVLSSYMMVESNVNIYHCCFSKFCIVVFIGVVFPTCYIFFWSLQIPPQCNSLQYFHHQLSTAKDKRKLLKSYYYCCIIRLNFL